MTPPEKHEQTDGTLIARARAGDARAFETLLLRHESRVFRVLALLGVARQDREDVAQEVFVRVFRHLRGFRLGRRFEPWLFRISVNAAFDHRRRQRKDRGAELPGDHEPATDPESERRLDLRRRLMAAMDLLTERERAVFVLRELEGLSTAEVARALRITSVTVRRHLGLARQRLRSRLGPGAPPEKS